MNNLGTPYGPGQKSQRLDEITSLAWNRQVQHILASASNSGCCSIWDLKMRREIIGLTSPTRRPFTAIAWNPDLVMLNTCSRESSFAHCAYIFIVDSNFNGF